MSQTRNTGRVAGLWYLLLGILSPISLIYIPGKLFVHGNAVATVNNILLHETLFRLGMVDDMVWAVVLIFLVMALYRLFAGVDRNVAVLMVILGGILPAAMNLVSAATNATALMLAKGPSWVLVLSKPQLYELVMLFLRFREYQNTAVEMLSGVWLFPLAILVYRSRVLPKFLGIWLAINGVAYVIMSLTGFLAPQYQGTLFHLFLPVLLGEFALILWLVIKGAAPVEDRFRE